jgi:cell division protein FtsL
MKLILMLIGGVVIVSSVQIVWVRHQNRLLSTELQTLQQQREILNEEWGQLQLEQGTWAQYSRIETLAHEQLHMRLPVSQDIVIIRP